MTTTSHGLVGNYIAGEWLQGDACERLAITDPATAETLGSVPLSGRTEVDRAVQAARAAFPAWRRTRGGLGIATVPPPEPDLASPPLEVARIPSAPPS